MNRIENEISALLLKMNSEQEHTYDNNSSTSSTSSTNLPFTTSPLSYSSTSFKHSQTNSFNYSPIYNLDCSTTTTYSDNSTFSSDSPSSFHNTSSISFDNNNNNTLIHSKKPKRKTKNNTQINLENILLGIDKRTTIMIKNIPNKYTQKAFTDEINIRFANTYDVFYLPIDYTNNCNLGFAFINFIHPFYIIDFYETYRGQKWMRYLSDKKCELAYGTVQGKQTLIKHFQKGIVLNAQTSDRKPMILNVPSQCYHKVYLHIKYKHIFETTYPYWQYYIDYTNEYIMIYID